MTAAGFGYGAAVVLAMMFVMAAVSKARAVGATEVSFVALGVPNAAASARVVPAVEVVIAIALLAVPSIGGAAALMTLAFFTTFLATRLRAGIRAPCACFGTATTEPLSIVKLVDNAFLVLAAIAATASARPTVPTGRDLVGLVAVIAFAVGLHLVLRHHRSASAER